MAAIQVEHDDEDTVLDGSTIQAQDITAAAFAGSAAGAVASNGDGSAFPIEEPDYGAIGDDHDAEVSPPMPAPASCSLP